ncbi:MAG: 2-hydroxy-acid oxidase [Deltaproteobacteria bacterium]|nr:MAG: 2-hydroxy-acid oxidase [Deltaproteobacteria bacterium]
MEFNPVRQNDIHYLASLVRPDQLSTGDSILDLHAKDQSYHPARRPEVVIWPHNRAEVSGILQYANSHRIPVTCWGMGTSVEGNPIPLYGGIVLDFSRMARILEIREADFQADVEPGVVYQDLNNKLRHMGLFFPPDPGARATIGGMLANNASGIRTVRYGSSRANVLRLTAVLANGEIIETGTRASKTSSGYDLINLFVGSEGTLGILVEATVRLRGLPETISAVIATFPDVEAAATAVSEMKRFGVDPASLELLSTECVEVINREKDLGLSLTPMLFIEFHEAGKAQVREMTNMAREICEDAGCYEFMAGIDREDRDKFLKARYELAEMIMRKHVGRTHTVIDVAVPVSAYPDMISLAREESRKAGVPGYTFGHAGDGNLHMIFMIGTEDRKEWSAVEHVNERLVRKALEAGGTATGEHGTGIGKRKFMKAEHGNSLGWMKKLKNLFDPNGILNPGKIFPGNI